MGGRLGWLQMMGCQYSCVQGREMTIFEKHYILVVEAWKDIWRLFRHETHEVRVSCRLLNPVRLVHVGTYHAWEGVSALCGNNICPPDHSKKLPSVLKAGERQMWFTCQSGELERKSECWWNQCIFKLIKALFYYVLLFLRKEEGMSV